MDLSEADMRRTRARDPRALFAAASSGNIDVALAEIDAGADIDARNRRRETPVLVAAKAGKMKAVGALIAAGADIDLQDETCLNPFLYGCIANNLELVRATVEAGADLDRLTRFGGNGLTPAAEKGYVDIVSYLVETTEINVNLTNTLGWTALIEAIILGDGGPAYQDVIRQLLRYGADPGLTDEWGVTPRELAARKGFTEIVAVIDATTPVHV